MEENQNKETIEQLEAEELLKALKATATTLGITYSPNIKAETLQAKIDAILKTVTEVQSKQQDEPVNKTPEELEDEKRVQLSNEMLKLVRCIVTCNDTTMVDWDMTPYYSISNSLITVPSQTIPLNVEWHIPTALFDMMSAMTCYVSTKSKDDKGRTITVRKEIKKYNLQVLPPLTEEELNDLKQAQIMRDGL